LGLQIVQTLVNDDLKGELQISAIAPQPAPVQDGAGPPEGETLEAEQPSGAILHGTQARVTFPKRSLKVD
jgi:hypothetical protein